MSKTSSLATGLLMALTAALSACAAVPEKTGPAAFQTSSPRWFDEIGHMPEIEGKGYLQLPKTAEPPFPAVIILHSSQGMGALERRASDILLARGIAVFLVDSFTPRGIRKIKKDQTEIAEVAIMADAFAALGVLRNNPRIDPNRIGVLGFSKGAIPALYMSFPALTDRFDAADRPFAAHAAFHPWCGLTPPSTQTSGAPVLIQSGGSDHITPAALCTPLAKAMRASGADVDMRVYEGAVHAFEHPRLKHIPALTIGYAVPEKCRVVSDTDGYRELTTEKTVIGATYREVISACSSSSESFRYRVGGHKAHAATAWEVMGDFFAAALNPDKNKSVRNEQ